MFVEPKTPADFDFYLFNEFPGRQCMDLDLNGLCALEL